MYWTCWLAAVGLVPLLARRRPGVQACLSWPSVVVGSPPPIYVYIYTYVYVHGLCRKTRFLGHEARGNLGTRANCRFYEHYQKNGQNHKTNIMPHNEKQCDMHIIFKFFASFHNLINPKMKNPT
ncbi:MAG: hypothetical protein ACKPKO_65305 [Candidatus Fonsibacter sp.]